MKTTTKIKKSVFAMPAEAFAIPPNPKMAAISATTRKIRAHPSKPIVASFPIVYPWLSFAWSAAAVLIGGPLEGFTSSLDVLAKAHTAPCATSF